MALTEGKLTKKYYNDFSGGVNLYLGPRQIKDKESPDAINCDFRGKGGVGSRLGYSQIGSVTSSRTAIYGMSEYHTSIYDQLIKFASNGSNIALGSSSDEAEWTWVTGTTFSDGFNVDVVQAGEYLFSANGIDTMKHYDGSIWATTTNGTIGNFPEYFAKALWVVDETNKYKLNVSGQWAASSSKLGDFVYNASTNAHAQTIEIEPGSGKEIRALKSFKNTLYVFLYPVGIYRIAATSTANTYSVTLITNAIGCVSHRSVAQVGEDLFFAADDGVYSIGEVANYTEVRSTNKSAKVQEIFDSLSAFNKTKLTAEYYDFKYHLFYSLTGSGNDSCLPYDVRYQSWQDWRDMAANDATLYNDSSGEINLYFGEPTTGKVMKMYSGSTDDGTSISSYWKSKSFDEEVPDILKLYLDSTFTFGALNGTVSVSVVFDDNETSSSKTLSQNRPQGGFGRDVLGRMAFGDATNTTTVTQVINEPYRLKAKGKKFAIQYTISASGASWTLDSVSQSFIPFGHYKFPSANKLS